MQPIDPEQPPSDAVREPTTGVAGNPLVSVVIPTYNRGHVIERAVASVLEQTYRPVEIVVVDDGSTDDTMERLGRILVPELKVLSTARNVGPARARNLGIAGSTGDYVAFLDSDDAWEPWKLEAQVRVLRNALSSRLGAVYCGRRIRLADGTRMEVRPHHRGDIFAALLRRNCVPLPTLLVKRAVLDAVGTFDPAMPACEDWDLVLRIARRFAFDYVAEPAIQYDGTGADRMSARARSVFIANHRILRRFNPGRPQRRVLAAYLALQSRELLSLGRFSLAARYALKSLWLAFDTGEKLALHTLRQLMMRRSFGRILVKAYAWRHALTMR